MSKTAKIDFHLTLKLIWTILSSTGFFFVAFNKNINQEIFTGLDGVIMAISGS